MEKKMGIEMKIKMTMLTMVFYVLLFILSGRTGGCAEPHAPHQPPPPGAARPASRAAPVAPHQLAPPGAARAAAPLPCGNVIGARRPIAWHGWPGRLTPSAGLAAGLPATYGAQGRATKLAILSQIAAGMGGSPRRWRPKSLPTRSCHRWLSLGHQGGPSPSLRRPRHRSHRKLTFE